MSADGSIWASLPVPAILIDREDTVADINPAAEGFLNASVRSAAGRLMAVGAFGLEQVFDEPA